MSKKNIISDIMDSIVLESVEAEIKMLSALRDDLIARPKREKPEPKDTAQGAPVGMQASPIKFLVGQPVSKKGGDYRFDGYVVAAFTKISGEIRYVVEDDRGILHIYSDKNLVAGA